MPIIETATVEHLPYNAHLEQRILGRNAVLKALLDESYITPESQELLGNYETARDLGIIDAFYLIQAPERMP